MRDIKSADKFVRNHINENFYRIAFFNKNNPTRGREKQNVIYPSRILLRQ